MITTDAPRFDAVKYKETTRQQWRAATRAWNDWGPFLKLRGPCELVVTVGTR